jgi:hypothetical protein
MRCGWPLPFLTTWLLPASALALPSDAEREQFFESRIRPVLAEHCFECHADSSSKVKGSLKLDSAAALLVGGDSGAVVVPGDAEASLLVRALRHTDPEVEMPPKGKLPDAVIADFAEWVRQGAYFPAAQAPAGSPSVKQLINYQKSEHWAFQPMARPVPPAVRNESWVRNEIDRFVLARLEQAGLAPAAAADKRAWLRRASFDLTGLPPTPAELEHFLSEAGEQAYERAIDALLAKPQYGERWGRHWLDLARYADSNGLDENLAMGNAWRYRDWVVAALNRDLPYDQFVEQQLAGDLLVPEEGGEQAAAPLAATGFLVLGPKMLAEQDKAKLVIDVVDEQIDVLTKAFMGLTVACARCHDHKFDPVSQRDYYALAGIFKSTQSLANTDFVSRWNEQPLATPTERRQREAYDKLVSESAKALESEQERLRAEVLARWEQDLSRYLLESLPRSGDVILLEAESASSTNAIVDTTQWGSREEPILRTGSDARPQYAEYSFEARYPGEYELYVRHAAEQSRPVRLSIDGAIIADKACGEVTGSWNLDGQRWSKQGRAELLPGRHTLRMESADHLPHFDAFALLPARAVAADPQAVDPEAGTHDFTDPDLAGAGEHTEVCEMEPQGQPLSPELLDRFALRVAKAFTRHDPVLAVWIEYARLPTENFSAYAADLATMLREEHAAGKWALNSTLHGLLHAPAPQSLGELAARYQTVFGLIAEEWRSLRKQDGNAAKLPNAEHEAVREFLIGRDGLLSAARDVIDRSAPASALSTISRLRAAHESLLAREPRQLPLTLAVTEGKLEELPIHIRGSHLRLEQQPVPRGVLTVLQETVAPPAFPAGQSGRLEFARWLANPEHPLTARVMVNRVWRGHFGRGLVDTPSNFGVRGETPSHPELLDWLARSFTADGWSLKRLHKRIMLSSAYRMSSVGSEAALSLDPENRNLSRMNRRRLEAEAVRDGMLAAAGKLDLSVGGSILRAGNGDYVTNDQSGNSENYATPRRSIYLPLIRNAIFDLFSTFDYPDPGMAMELRSSTTDANQALLLMNSPLSLEASEGLASLVLQRVDCSDRQRLDEAWQRAYARPATDAEAERALRWLVDAAAKSPGGRQDAWQALCQMLFASNEFLHID